MKRTTPKGFTLMEVIISITIITIAFFAVLVTQGTALNGYANTRDSTSATEIGRVVIEKMNMEGMDWTNGCFSTLTTAVYDSGSVPFEVNNQILPYLLTGTAWEWKPLNVVPLDSRGAHGTNVVGRYCVFARGGFVEMKMSDLNTVDETSGDFVCSPVFQSQIAVVYAGANTSLSTCAGFNKTLLTPESNHDLEIKGYRASYFGNVVVRREW